MTPSRDQGAGIIRPRSRRSQMIRRRVLVFAAGPGLSRRNQLPALVKIILYYIAVRVVPFRDQYASRAVLEPRRHPAHDLLHSTAVPVVNVLARRTAHHGRR